MIPFCSEIKSRRTNSKSPRNLQSPVKSKKKQEQVKKLRFQGYMAKIPPLAYTASLDKINVIRSHKTQLSE
jgi:hypothetical protein